MRLVKAVCASKKDVPAFTYRTSQFKDLVFSAGDVYLFEYENGDIERVKASRQGDTLYSGKRPHNQPVPTVGNPTTHKVVAVYKELKTAVKSK